MGSVKDIQQAAKEFSEESRKFREEIHVKSKVLHEQGLKEFHDRKQKFEREVDQLTRDLQRYIQEFHG